MAGLIALGIVALYLTTLFFIVRALAQRTSSPWIRWALYGIGLPLLLAAPLADEIIGKFQFDALCREAEEIKIYGSIPVGEELYTPEGKWRLGMRHLHFEERNRIEATYKAIVRDESIGPTKIQAVIPIQMYEHRLTYRKDDRPLAAFRIYGTRGGWISQNLEKPIIVRDVCWPSDMGLTLDQRILPFEKNRVGR